MINAGIRNKSANNQATGSPRHTPKNPNAGTSHKLTPVRAIISATPEHIDRLLYPKPCILYLKMVSIPSNR